jgi:hypothetical protein
MIDAVAVYGFRCQVYFKGIVFVPSIPNDAVIEERVKLPWKKQPETRDEEKTEDDSWSSIDIRNMVPDTYSCIIKVSVAPNSLPHNSL